MIALIDGDSLIYLSLPKVNDETSTYEKCIQELHSRINTILNNVGATHYAIFLTEGKCFRYKKWKFSDDYKSNRKNNKRDPIFYALKEYMRQNFNIVSHNSLEADDLVAVYAHEIKQKTIICSPDKDVLRQISGTHYNYKDNTFVETSQKEAFDFLVLQTMMGDTTDNVKGINGVGEKTSLKLLQDHKALDKINICLKEYIKRYGSIYEGINRFFETFSMVYLLKSFQQVEREVGIKLDKIKLEEVERKNNDETNW